MIHQIVKLVPDIALQGYVTTTALDYQLMMLWLDLYLVLGKLSVLVTVQLR